MSVKVYFILLSCLAYYAMSVPTKTNKPKEDVTITVVNSVEDSTTIEEQVKQEENPPTTTLPEDQLDMLWELFERANEEGSKIPLAQILTNTEYSKEVFENLDEFVKVKRQRGPMDREITFNDFIDGFREFNSKQNTVLSSEIIKALSDAVKKETDNGDVKITFKKLESVMETISADLDLTEFEIYLFDNVFVDENYTISHDEFTKAMAEFKELEIKKNSSLSSVIIRALSDAVNKETDNNDGKITFETLKSVLKTMPADLDLTALEIYLVEKVFFDELGFCCMSIENGMGDLEENDSSVLLSDMITALSDAVKKETDNGDGTITFKNLESVMETMPENLVLTEFKAYLLENVFVDENHSISHEEFTKAMAEFNELDVQKGDLEENDSSVLSSEIIKALSDAVKKETDNGGGKVTFETLKSVMKTMPPDLALTAFEIYLVEKFLFNENYSISHDEFTKAMAEFNELDIQKKYLLSKDIIRALSDAVKIETVNNDGRITLETLECVMETMPVHLDLTTFVTYLLENVFVNKNHSISHEEFTKVMKEFNKLEIQKLMFRYIDSDYDNKIFASEIHKYMTSIGGLWSLENCEKIIKQYDLEGKNYLNFAEFRMIVTEEKSELWYEEFAEMDLNKDGILLIDELRVRMEKLFAKFPEVEYVESCGINAK